MAFHYTDRTYEHDPDKLPNLGVFFISAKDAAEMNAEAGNYPDDIGQSVIPSEGWYYWSCFPGCLPDGDPIGPFATYSDALMDATKDEEGVIGSPHDRFPDT